jgi:CTP:molybdopterin cytidylyltransferase MocA
MGRPKLLLPVDGRPMVAWVVDLVDRLPLDERVIVLGAEAEAIRDALFPLTPTLSHGGERDEG